MGQQDYINLRNGKIDMKINVFKEKLLEHIESNFESFALNMEETLEDTNLDFCVWISFFIAWMEWASEAECYDNYTEDEDG